MVTSDFRFEIQQDGPNAQVAVGGDFDMTGVLRLEPQLGRLLDAGGCERLLFDLSGLDFIDSTALGVLIDLDRRARMGDFELSIVPGPRHVQRVFEVTKLSETLPFQDPEAP